MGNKIKSKIAAMSLGVIAATGALTFGSALAAPSAEAYTDYDCKTVRLTDWKGDSYWPYPVKKSCWRDYNWWEESFLGGLHKDGWT